MPIFVRLMVDHQSDLWLREMIRGEPHQMPTVQSVIVENSREADRIVARMAALKLSRGLPYGGACWEVMC